MKIFKKTVCLIVAVLLVVSMSACHPKEEVAVTVGDVTISSALYMAALIQADGEAKNKVSEQQENSGDTSNTQIDYYAQKVDGKKFVDYVKARALEICGEFAAYEILKKEGKYKITDEKLSEADYYADFYWSNYGYDAFYGDNGVSLNTYKKHVKYSYMADAYFLSLYGEGGSKAVDKATINKTMKEKFEVVRRIDVSYESDMTDAEKAALKTKFQDYEKRLKSGTSFETIYNEYNKTDESTTSSAPSGTENQIDVGEDSTSSAAASTASGSASSAATSSSTTSSGTKEPEPKDKYATVVGAEGTDSEDPDFAEIKKMKVGDVKLFSDDEGLSLVVRGDITADPYYLKNLNDSILRLLKKDEFDKSMKDYVAKLDIKENTYATGRFKVKDIKYPSYQ